MNDRNRLYDRRTIEILRRVLAPDSNAIDVGAHCGSLLEHIVGIAPNGFHVAFEPITSFAEQLHSRFPSVEVHRMALADASGEAAFHHVVSNPAYSGLRRRRFDRPHEDVEIVTVPVGRLDDVIPAERPIRMVKIDVEGAELRVLRGAGRTLEQHRPYIVFEFGLGAADVYGARPDVMYDLLEGHGLRLSLLGDWLEGRPCLTCEEFVVQFDEHINYYFLAHPD